MDAFPLPGAQLPLDITTGPDANLWFTTGSTDLVSGGFPSGSLGRITPNGTISIFPTDYPTFGVTAGPDRALWATSRAYITRVTTNGQVQYFFLGDQTAESVATAGAITAGPDGALWFTAGCLTVLPAPAGLQEPCPYGIGRLTTDGQVTGFSQVDADSQPLFITRGPEDNLWFTRLDGRISRLTPAGRVDDIVFYSEGDSANVITTGPDGALWVTIPTAKRLGRVFSLPRQYIPIANSGPLGMAPGPDGSVWFTDEIGNRVGKLTRGGGLIQYELGDGHAPTGIAAAPDGGAFFTNFQSGTIGRITPEGEFVEYTLRPPNDSPEEIVLGPDGNFWFTIDVNSIGRITPTGVVTTFATPSEDGGPQGITVGPDGNLWFAEYIANKIARMTTDGQAVDYPIPSDNAEPWDIAVGADNNLYFTESGTGRIARITTGGAITELGVPNPAASPRDLTLGPDGALWYSIVPVQGPEPAVAAPAAQPRIATDPTPTPTLGPARLGRLARDGRITSFDLTDDELRPEEPAGIVGTADGFLFVALYDTASILMIELASAQPFATPTRTFELATPTPTERGGTCAGDCDGDGMVSIGELISAVNIALGNRSIDTCRAADVDGNDEVRINDLITAVGRALQGC